MKNLSSIGTSVGESNYCDSRTPEQREADSKIDIRTSFTTSDPIWLVPNFNETKEAPVDLKATLKMAKKELKEWDKFIKELEKRIKDEPKSPRELSKTGTVTIINPKEIK